MSYTEMAKEDTPSKFREWLVCLSIFSLGILSFGLLFRIDAQRQEIVKLSLALQEQKDHLTLLYKYVKQLDYQLDVESELLKELK